MRLIVIRVEGIKRPIHKLPVHEGTRVSDILRYLKVPDGYRLALASNPTHPLPLEAEVHALVADADHLIARSNSAAVGTAAAFTLSLSN